jgi:hypothetical protein
MARLAGRRAGLLLPLLLLSSLLLLNVNRRLVRPTEPGTGEGPPERDTISFSAAEQAEFQVAEVAAEEGSPAPARTFPLAPCACLRSLPGPALSLDTEPALAAPTCGRDAWARGSQQKVLGFSFYGATNSSAHRSKKYFQGIEANLAVVPALYGPGWSVRLYHDLEPGSPLLVDLCRLACAAPHLDLCYVRELPGVPLADAAKMFPMNWRFLPTLDPQVELFLCRDLDSLISRREVAAVAEWAESGRAVHSMRDHPAHSVPLLGAAWGARLTQPNIRHKWARSWERMLADPQCWAGRQAKGPDQELLTRHVWPWARHMALEHDSYRCHDFPNSIGFPTRREDAENNFVAAVVNEGGGRLWKMCPKKCRRKLDWEHC